MYLFGQLVAVILFLISIPVFIVLFLIVKTSSSGPFLFSQLRIGHNKKPFRIYKIRTMVEDAESIKKKYKHLNQADGPVFKIKNDPRFTKIGKWLARTGLDELPQLINVMNGEMAFVGPRPLPIEEANKIPKKYKRRFDVLPGITSMWVIQGSHKLSFREWMELDVEYVENKSFSADTAILIKTIVLLLKHLFK